MASKKVRVAIVGLGFGAEFIPIYQAHPDAEMYAICRRNETELNACGDKFGIKKRYRDLLKDKEYLDLTTYRTSDTEVVKRRGEIVARLFSK